MTDGPTPKLLDGRSVSRRLKLSAGTLDELKREGKVRDFDGRYDLEEVRRALTHETATIETTVSEDAQTRALDLAAQLADRAMGREGKMFDLYARHLAALVDALQLENKALRADAAELRVENKKLHEQLLEGLKVKEALLSKQHERELLGRMVDQKSATQREAVGLLKQAWPLVKNHFRTAAGNSIAKQLFDSIEDSQIEAILSIDFLTEEQKGLLQKLTSDRRKQINGAGEASSNGAAEAHQNGVMSS